MTLHEPNEEALSRVVGYGSGGGVNRAYHLDALGSVGAVTDATQATVTRYQTDAWGNVLSGAVADEPAVYGGGLGYWYDPDLSLYYVRARWLNPATGRWLSVDPVESEQRYAYVGNQPTTKVDPSGQESVLTAWFEDYVVRPGYKLAAAAEGEIEAAATTALIHGLAIFGVDERASRPLISQIIAFLKRLGGSLLYAVYDFVGKLRGWVDAAGHVISAAWHHFVAALGRGMEKYMPPKDAGGIALYVLGIVVAIIKSAIARFPIVQVVNLIQAAFELLSHISVLRHILDLFKEIALGPFMQLFSVEKPPAPYARGFSLAELVLGIIDFIKGIRNAIRRLGRSRVPGQMAPAHSVVEGEHDDFSKFDKKAMEEADEALKDPRVRAAGRHEHNRRAQKKASKALQLMQRLTKPSSSRPLPVRKGPHFKEGTQRGHQLERESADVLARKGYDVERGPALLEEDGVDVLSRPDYRIEGRLFDSYAAQAKTPFRGMQNAIAKKVGRQTFRVVVNLQDSPYTPGQLRHFLQGAQIPGLAEVFAVRDGELFRVLP